jgi:zinc transporter ZupT
LLGLAFSFLSALSTIVGGLIPIYTRVREVGTRYLIGFASGVMVSVALLAMLPEIAEEGGINFIALALGFFSIYLVEKLVLLHSCGESECEFHTIGWTSLIGIAAESLLDGVAIAVGFSLTPAVGATVALAVIAHEFPRGFTTAVIMQGAGYRRVRVLGALAIDALFTPLGAALVLLGLFPQSFFVPLFSFAAGTFLYVGASDLLPEAHRRFNIRVVALVMLGVVVIPLVELLTGI